MNLGEILLIAAFFITAVAIIIELVPGEKTFTWKWVGVFLTIAFSLILVDILLLIDYQLKGDFSFAYVYNHISTDMDKIYRVSALWAGQEGSFLLWSMINIGTGFFFLRDVKKISTTNRIALVVFLCISSAILLITLLCRPFRLLESFQSEGLGLNPSLKNLWMVVHPPLVFIGYSAMAVLFSLSFMSNKEIDDKQNAYYLKKWVLVSWLFLGMGILSGSIWSYQTVGWGGYWAWDPIENAALIPWLLLTGLVHCNIGAANEKGNRINTKLPFVLAVFGVFLARSGILQGKSVHAYVTSFLLWPSLIFLLLLIALIILRYVFAAGKKDYHYKKLNRITVLTYNFWGFAFLVFIGTVLPLLAGIKINISYFNYTSLFFSLICCGMFIYVNWTEFQKNYFKVLVLCTLITTVIVFWMKFDNYQWVLVIWVSLIPLLNWLVDSTKVIPKIIFQNMPAALSHTGFILLIIGAVVSSAFDEQGVLVLDTNQSIQINGVDLVQTDLNKGKNVIIKNIAADIVLSPTIPGLSPEISKKSQMVSYTTKPFINLLWLGGLLIMIGNLGALIRIRQVLN